MGGDWVPLWELVQEVVEEGGSNALVAGLDAIVPESDRTQEVVLGDLLWAMSEGLIDVWRSEEGRAGERPPEGLSPEEVKELLDLSKQWIWGEPLGDQVVYGLTDKGEAFWRGDPM